MKRAAENVFAGVVRAKDMDEPVFDAKQMRGEGDPQHLIFPALHEEFDIFTVFGVDGRHPAEIRGDAALALHAIDEGLRGTSVMIAEFWDLRRAVCVVFIRTSDGWIIGRQKWREDAAGNQENQDSASDHRDPVLFKPLPYQLLLRGCEIRLFRFLRDL